MRILELYDFDGASGVSRVARTLTEGFRARGHTVFRMLGRSDFRGDLPILEPACLSAQPHEMMRAAWRIRQVVRERSIEVVHAHHRRLAFLSKIAVGQLGVPVVEHVHSAFSDKALTSFRGDAIICLSEGLSTVLQRDYGHAKGKVDVCHNGVDVPERITPMLSPEGALQLLVVGRVELSKNPEGFVSLLHALNERGVRAQGTWLGDGPLLEVYRARAGTHCAWLGAVEDVTSWIQRSHCAVSMSFREGVPFGLLDAMALGRPVLASAVGGIGELVDDRVGRLWQPFTPLESVVDIVGGFLSDFSEMQACGMRARERIAEEWSSVAMVGRCEQILHGVLRG